MPPATLHEACERFVENVRHSARLNMDVLETAPNNVKTRLPWQENLVGNPETGILHGGAIFAFMDQTGGLANMCASYPEFEITPTIDMRVDHLRAPAKGCAIICEAECYRKSQQVLFVRIHVYEEGNKDDLVTTGLATYMRMKLPNRQTGDNANA